MTGPTGTILRVPGGEAVFIERQGFVALLSALSLAGLVRGATMARLERGEQVVLAPRDVARMKGFLAQVVRPNLGPGQRLRADMTVARDGDGLHGEVLVALVRFLRRARGPVTVGGQVDEAPSVPAAIPRASAATLAWVQQAGYA